MSLEMCKLTLVPVSFVDKNQSRDELQISAKAFRHISSDFFSCSISQGLGSQQMLIWNSIHVMILGECLLDIERSICDECSTGPGINDEFIKVEESN